MNSPEGVEPLAEPFGSPASQRCRMCGDQVGEKCFCRIPSEVGGPIRLCCPDCAIQYFDSVSPMSMQQQQLERYANSVHLLIGENKPWL
jgi:hypothetical protein